MIYILVALHFTQKLHYVNTLAIKIVCVVLLLLEYLFRLATWKKIGYYKYTMDMS